MMGKTATSKKVTPVSHPIAFDAGGRLVDVIDAQRGSNYVCVHCARRVVPSLGKKLQWHYRHVEVSSCAPRSDLLLETALKAIRAAFQNALDTQQKYPLSVPCYYCPARLDRDLTDLFDRADIIPASTVGQRDRLMLNPRKRSATHLEVAILVGSDAAPSVDADGPPTITVPADWDGVASLSNGLVADRYIASAPLLCRLCRLIDSPKKIDSPLSPITAERYGDPLYPEMYDLVNSAAEKLHDLGFRQSSGKPYLLYRRFGGYVKGVVFADFGGLSHQRIWQTRCGRLYGQFTEPDQNVGAALLSRVATICESRGIPLSLPDSQGAGA